MLETGEGFITWRQGLLAREMGLEAKAVEEDLNIMNSLRSGHRGIKIFYWLGLFQSGPGFYHINSDR